MGIKLIGALKSGLKIMWASVKYYVNNLWAMWITSLHPTFKPLKLGITLWILWITESVFAYYL